ADSVHHQVEQSLKAQKKTYDFEDFSIAVGNACKGKIEVVKMETNNFFQWKSCKSEQKMKNMEKRVYLSDIVVMKAVRGEWDIKYKLSYQPEEEFKAVDFLQHKFVKKNIIPDPPNVPGPEGFPLQKKVQLLQALHGILPENRKKFWEDLPTC
ncbi:hypothetical protein J6590_096549, partial [Homalodisca vitripennis]